MNCSFGSYSLGHQKIGGTNNHERSRIPASRNTATCWLFGRKIASEETVPRPGQHQKREPVLHHHGEAAVDHHFPEVVHGAAERAAASQGCEANLQKQFDRYKCLNKDEGKA
jgi:hypothetical protein